MENILVGINSKYVHTNLAIRYLKKFVEKNSDFEIEIYENTVNNNINKIIRDIMEKNAKQIFFSVYVWNIEIILKISKELKKISKDLKIILGGPEVSYTPRKIMEENSFIDGIIIGEGELTLLSYLKDEGKKLGIYYKEKNQIKFNGQQKLIENLDIIPFPYSEEELKDIHKIIYYESTRGCPFNCSYCMSSLDKKVRFFSLERTKRDLKIFIKEETRLVKFVDRTFNLQKERYLEIWKYLLENYKENITFHFEINANIFDKEVLDFLKEVPKGFFQFEIGVQTINDITMKVIKRENNIEKLFDNVTAINKNIHLHLDLIAGLPFENYDIFEKSFNYVYETKCSMIQLGFLKILKGTEMQSKVEEYEYKYMDFPPYEILSNRFLSYEEVCKLKDIEEILDYYYNSQKFIKSLDFVISNFYSSPFKFFEEIGEYYKKNNYLDVAHKEVAIFNYFVEFYKIKNFEKIQEFLEFLKFDYLMIKKPGYYPDWIDSNKDKEKYHEELKKRNFKSIREAYKKTEIEKFNINIDNKLKMQVDILFDYTKKDTNYFII